MFGYRERDDKSSLTGYLYEQMSPEALMLYALLEFHDYNQARDTYDNRRNKIMKLPDSAGEEQEKGKGEQEKMRRCIRCDSPLTGKQRKYCSQKCSRQKEVAKFRSSYQPVTEERKQKVKDYEEGKIELTHEEKQKLWYDLSSYRILFKKDSRKGEINGRD